MGFPIDWDLMVSKEQFDSVHRNDAEVERSNRFTPTI